MSRHKLVKALDLNAELDDYDGGEDYEDYEDENTDGRPILSLGEAQLKIYRTEHRG